MRNRFLSLFLIGVLLIGVGCSQANDTGSNPSVSLIPPGPPEPYTKAVDELAKPDFQTALRYLDLVIKDFPDNKEYVYKAHVLRSIIYANNRVCGMSVLKDMTGGIEHGRVFFTDADVTRLKAIGGELLSDINKMKDPSIVSANYIMTNYGESTKDYAFSLTIPPLPKDTPALNRLDWFNKIGTPIPSDNEFRGAVLENERMMFPPTISKGLIKENRVDYPAFFLAIGSLTYEWDKETAKQMYLKVLEITENDKYNENRIGAEDNLKKIK